ncbi:hypothetical protein VMCG_08483 [Cytospora schulzeri]|uniref:Uncharacterized protein n=1 Tax=Cytospora schulzeri TaxID=448051 RepID=A0A423VWP4_9PEZI|nr:hypothetical protein VMCG_08483 [Valsa malicola]
MGEINPIKDPNRDIAVEMVIMPQRTIRASTAQHTRRLVPPVVVRTRDPRVIYGFGEANFQFYVKVTLCNPVDGSAIDEDNPLVGGASQMITQRHVRSYIFDMRDPDGPYVYFVFRDLYFERLGEFKMNINMQVVDYRCYEQNRMLWWLERHGCVESRSFTTAPEKDFAEIYHRPSAKIADIKIRYIPIFLKVNKDVAHFKVPVEDRVIK